MLLSCNCWENTCTFVRFLILFLQHQTLSHAGEEIRTPGSSWYVARLSNDMFFIPGELSPVIISIEVTQNDIFILSVPRRMIVNIFVHAHHSENLRFKKFQVNYMKWISSKDEILQVTSPSFSDPPPSILAHLLTLISCYPLTGMQHRSF